MENSSPNSMSADQIERIIDAARSVLENASAMGRNQVSVPGSSFRALWHAFDCPELITDKDALEWGFGEDMQAILEGKDPGE